jgi:ribulose-bisphosphate carboxylase small chain
MYLRHGAFSYLPELTDDEIAAQVRHALLRGWPVSIEHTTDPHPRNIYWEMWGLPLFDLTEPDGVMAEINACRSTFPEHYVRVLAYDASLGRQTTAMQFLVQRPTLESDLELTRTEAADRQQRYAVGVRESTPAGTRDGG